MLLKRIVLENFRNYKGADLICNPFINFLVGGNAQGKTNLIEAIYYLSSGRSYRYIKDRVLISRGSNYAKIQGEIVNKHGDYLIEFYLNREGKKKFFINRREITKLSDILGLLNIVIFTPDHLDLIKSGPENRRKFLDEEISQISPVYRQDLSSYKRVVFQRNSLLKKGKYFNINSEQMRVWEKQLVVFGTRIMLTRKKFLERLAPLAEKVTKQITGSKELLRIHYKCGLDIDLSNWESLKVAEIFLETLRKNRKRDYEKGITSVGPHRDDLCLEINNQELRYFGSQGQQRTVVLAAKLGQLELYKERTTEYPLLLLDDVFSELDEQRRASVLNVVRKMVQTFITSTTLPRFQKNKDLETVIYISEGKINKDKYS